MSKLEDYIDDLLYKDNIAHWREFQVRDLRNGLCRFDFYSPNDDFAIEVNGIQHYEYTSHFYKSKSDFLKAQERDRRKIAYCLAHGIKLYIIPYWDVFNVHCAKDIFQDKYLAHTKFHNDEVYRNQKSKLSSV